MTLLFYFPQCEYLQGIFQSQGFNLRCDIVFNSLILSLIDSPFDLKIILPARTLPKTLHKFKGIRALFFVHDHFSSLKP